MKDTDPFICQSTYRGVMPVSFVSLLEVEGSGPEGMPDGLASPFVEALFDEDWTCASSQSERVGLITGAVEDRSDAAEGEDGTGRRESLATGAESSQQASAVDLSCGGQALEDEGVRMFTVSLGDFGQHAVNGLLKHFDLAEQSVHEDGGGIKERLIVGQGYAFSDNAQSCIQSAATYTLVLSVEVADGVGPSAFERLECGPLAQESDGQWSKEAFASELECLRVIGFERGDELVGELCALIDESPAMSDQRGNPAGECSIGTEGFEILVTVPQEPCDDLRIEGITFRSTGFEGKAVSCDRTGVEGEEINLRESLEEVQEGTGGLLDSQGDACQGEAGNQIMNPVGDAFRTIGELSALDEHGAVVDEDPFDEPVTSVDTDESRILHKCDRLNENGRI